MAIDTLRGSDNAKVSWWLPVLFGALAGGMGWGIRGQYGHETGAMIAGLLISLVVVVLVGSQLPRETALRAIAWGTIAIGFGGSMTYGQTVGLTHDAALVGNWSALRWGMLGLAIKGGLWIGFVGLFLGMGLGGVRYRVVELLGVMLAAIVVYFVGTWLLNSPFDPEARRLPWLYFSDDWHWEPDAALKPRRECWGGMLLALATSWAYAGWYRRDALACRLAGWATVGGAIGFPLGQSIQAFHAWNPEVFHHGVWVTLAPHINWWNMMEITFGTTAGAFIGFGAWNGRHLVRAGAESVSPLNPVIAWCLLAVHGVLLVLVEFASIRWVDVFYDLGLILGFIPIVAVAGGRWWPLAVALPITLVPIAGKSLRQLVHQEHWMAPFWGWVCLLILPLAIAVGMAVWLARSSEETVSVRKMTALLLATNAIVYFGLNFAFFHLPWPWDEWTGRTPSGIIFTICVSGLVWLAWTRRKVN